MRRQVKCISIIALPDVLKLYMPLKVFHRKENIFRLLQLDDVKAYVRVGGQRRGRRSCRLIRVR